MQIEHLISFFIGLFFGLFFVVDKSKNDIDIACFFGIC